MRRNACDRQNFAVHSLRLLGYVYFKAKLLRQPKLLIDHGCTTGGTAEKFEGMATRRISVCLELRRRLTKVDLRMVLQR